MKNRKNLHLIKLAFKKKKNYNYKYLNTLNLKKLDFKYVTGHSS